MAYAALAVSLLALAFTIGSFWWLHARRGILLATEPRSYAFTTKVRLRLPLAFFNTGAVAQIVSDLRVTMDDQQSHEPLRWITTRSKLRPESDDGFAFATPFSVEGRATREIVCEFGSDLEWVPEPGSRHEMRLQAQIHPSMEWSDIVAFDWWSPPSADLMKQYIAHRNEPPEASSSAPATPRNASTPPG